MGNLKNKAVNGVKWNCISTSVTLVLQVLKLAILTRILEKTDFGIIAIAMMVISLTEVFSELGLTIGIIHKQDITIKQYSSLYWMNVILSLVMYVILCFLTPLMVLFYKEERLLYVIPLLGLQILFNGVGKMFQTIKTKNMEFSLISKVKVSSVIIGFMASIIFAYIGMGVYSLVLGQVIQVGINQLFFAIVGRSEYIIQLHFRFSDIREFVSIGLYNLGGQLLDTLASRLDILIVGKFFSMEELGIYNIAKDLILKPCSIIVSLVYNVASSMFAKLQSDIDNLKNAFYYVLRIVSCISIPIYFSFFIFADLMVSILYDSKFGEVSVFLRILFIIGILNSINYVGTALQVAKGRTDLGFLCTIYRVIISMIILIITSCYSIKVVAIGQVLASIIFFVISWKMIVNKLSSISCYEYFKSFFDILFIFSLVSIISLCGLHLIGFSYIFSFIHALAYLVFSLWIVSKKCPMLKNLFISITKKIQ